MFMFGVDYTPTKKQEEWHKASEILNKPVGRGAGKSTFIVMDALKFAVENDGARVDVVSRTYTQSKYLIEIFCDRVPSNLYVFNRIHHIATLKNGSEIHFTYSLSSRRIFDVKHMIRGSGPVSEIFLE